MWVRVHLSDSSAVSMPTPAETIGGIVGMARISLGALELAYLDCGDGGKKEGCLRGGFMCCCGEGCMVGGEME